MYGRRKSFNVGCGIFEIELDEAFSFVGSRDSHKVTPAIREASAMVFSN